METAIILKCTCKSDFQDKEYGKNIRVHSVNKKDKTKRVAYCIVCSNSRRRNKTAKTITVSEGKVFGMHYTDEAVGNKTPKSY